MLSMLPIENHENAVKMLTMIVAVFALFWLPGQLMSILFEFHPQNDFLNYGLDIAYLFVFSNCVANPFIFAYYSKDHNSTLNPRRRPSTETAEINPSDSSKCVPLRETQGNIPMKNFLEFLKTMKEDRLKIYFDSTPETILT